MNPQEYNLPASKTHVIYRRHSADVVPELHAGAGAVAVN